MSESTAPSWMRELVVRLCVAAAGFGAGVAVDVAEPTPSAEMIWCCDGTDGGCEAVESFADCPENSWLYYCVQGQSIEQSGLDGESGW